VDNRLLHRILARISAAALVRGGTDLNRKRSCQEVTADQAGWRKVVSTGRCGKHGTHSPSASSGSNEINYFVCRLRRRNSVFLPATAPSGVGINEYYKSDEDYFHALAAEMARE
jgi:hypothetical protein